MARPQCPKNIRIHSPQQVVLPASVLDQFEHVQRAITDVEQILILHHKLQKNGDSLINKINSISQKNPDYAKFLEEGRRLLENVEYPGVK